MSQSSKQHFHDMIASRLAVEEGLLSDSVMLLSLVTITKGDPGGLERTLASTRAWRDLPTVEQIVVDGDGTAEVLAKASGCRWIRQQHEGIADAFNVGLSAAQGEWIWYLNGGDRVHPGLETEWLLRLLTTTKANLVTGGIQYDGDVDFRPVPSLRVQWPPSQCWLAHPATIVRHSLLKRAGGFDSRWTIVMDYDLWLRLLKCDPHVDVVSIPFARFDINGLCQRPEMRPLLQRENAQVLLTHSRWLLRTWLGIGRQMLSALWHAWRKC